MMNFFKKKNEFGNCFLCSDAILDKNYGSLAYKLEGKDIEYAKICNVCADLLDKIEKQTPLETEDHDESI